jgi:hypothetical protein
VALLEYVQGRLSSVYETGKDLPMGTHLAYLAGQNRPLMAVAVEIRHALWVGQYGSGSTIGRTVHVEKQLHSYRHLAQLDLERSREEFGAEKQSCFKGSASEYRAYHLGEARAERDIACRLEKLLEEGRRAAKGQTGPDPIVEGDARRAVG